MGARINTDFSLKYKRSIPGPGSYQVASTDLCQGHFLLSNFRYCILNAETLPLPDISVK